MQFHEAKLFSQPPQTAGEIEETFRAQFPEQFILSLPKEKPTEVIVEIEPTSAHETWSNVIAAVSTEGSTPHFNDTSERYRVDTGILHLYTKDGNQPIEEHILTPGQEYEINPGIIHWAQSEKDWTIIQAMSYPEGWTPESHHIVEKPIE